jgi:non-specific serine/threonine protein kinase/serine/threonine-protein kinase
MKCLEKDRTRRYDAASDLARDIERYLDDEPVEACPPGRGYRLRKFVRRHRGGVLTAAACVLLLAAGTAVSTWQAIRATAAERRAEEQAAAAQATYNFLQMDLLGPSALADKNERNPNLTVREMLDRAASLIEQTCAGQELTEANIRLAIGNAYSMLGEQAEAQEQLERALAISRRRLPPNDGNRLSFMYYLALVYKERGRNNEAAVLMKQALDGMQAHLAPTTRPCCAG